MSRRPLLYLAAAALAAAAFVVYWATLLPGQDLGDTASFQAIAGERIISPREGYPLYFVLTGGFVRFLPVEPAYATNLASAVCAAVAVGLAVIVATELAGTLAAGLAAGVFLAGSYTFWSQAIIAEVYALHVMMTGLCLVALFAWSHRPTMPRLALFFALYATAFGNHLSTVLLLPAFTAFLFVSAPGGMRAMLRPRVLLLATAIAAAGALQYWWNFSTLVAEPGHPGLGVMLRTFWFDVTKADWRATMVDGIGARALGNRLGMYWFDLRQQVGVPGVALALTGLAFLWSTRWRYALLLSLMWCVNWAFAFTYNVGDTHVFYIPSHFCVCLAAGCGVGWLALAVRLHLQKSPRPDLAPGAAGVVAAVLLCYPAWRVRDTWPALDRSTDSAPQQFFEALTRGMTSDEVLVRDMNWQTHNGLDYFAKYTRPSLTVFDGPENMQAFPFLVWENASRGRDLVLTAGIASEVQQAFGRLFPVEPDPRARVPRISTLAESLPRGTLYAVVALSPYPDIPVDPADIQWVGKTLSTRDGFWPQSRYAAAVGRTGEPPVWVNFSSRPFRGRTVVAGIPIEIRVEAWLPDDTIRRQGFGRVLVGRTPAVTLDRGATFVAFDQAGHVLTTCWAGGILAPEPRFVIRHGRVAP